MAEGEGIEFAQCLGNVHTTCREMSTGELKQRRTGAA